MSVVLPCQTCVLTALAAAFFAGGCAHLERWSLKSPSSFRFETADAAAYAAGRYIRRLNGLHPSAEASEWSFNIFRDERGFYPDHFHTDREAVSVSYVIDPAAVASGHNHTNYRACFGPRRSRCTDGETLSTWDRSEWGVLRAQERAGLFIPHYLVTPTGRVRVWEWDAGREEWREREALRVSSRR